MRIELIKYNIFNFILTFYVSINSAHAAIQCINLFKNSSSANLNISNEKTEVQSLETLGKAMTEGMLLNSEQAEIFGIYKQVFFGDPKTSLGGNNLTTVIGILKKYPDLAKNHFPEFEIRAVEKVYETPKALDKFIRSQITTFGQVRNNLFQIEANLSFWKKVLDYKDPMMPESLKPLNLGKETTEQERARARAINDARSEFQEKAQKRFIKYLDRIISKTNRDLLADLKSDHVVYEQKAKALFETLKYLEAWMSQKGRDTRTIRQTMLDLVFTIGYGNQSTMSLLKSTNAMDKIQGLNQLWNEADAFAEVLKYSGHFAELKAKLNVEFPTGLSKNEVLVKMIQEFEKDVLNSPYSTRPTDVIRVRSLSIQESPFRSCLGADCSSRTYFDKALDPNYIYFTMTDVSHKSNGQATTVLGTAINKQTGQQENVAFLDKLQNIPTQKIELFLDAMNRSLQEKGYRLAIPTDLGKHIPGHGGLSNMEVITDFVQINIMSRLDDVRAEFTPHSHEYQFSNSYSRGDQKLEVRIFEPKPIESNVEVKKGKQYTPSLADKSLDKNKIAQDFLKLRDSNKEEDQLKFIKSGRLVEQLESLGLYSKSDFKTDLEAILNRVDSSFSLRKNAFYELLFIDFKYLNIIERSFSKAEFMQLHSEMGHWKNSSDGSKKNFIKEQNDKIINSIRTNSLDSMEKLLKLPGLDINVKDNVGDTALLLAAKSGHKKVIELLLKYPGIDVNAKNTSGETALISAVRSGSKEIVEFLLKQPGVDVNTKSNTGVTALTTAIRFGFREIEVLLLKQHGFNVNAKDNEGNTPLILVIEDRARKEIVEFLLKQPGIDVNTKNDMGLTALTTAIKFGLREIVEILLKQPGIDVNVWEHLNSAIKYKRKEIVELLLKQPGIAESKFLSMALIDAVESGSKEIVEFLLKQPGIDINARNYFRNSALINAVKSGSKEIVELLLKQPGIDVNAKNDSGLTALLKAVEFGSREIVELLLKQPGIDINARNYKGSTALGVAAKYERLNDIQRLLQAHGATRMY